METDLARWFADQVWDIVKFNIIMCCSMVWILAGAKLIMLSTKEDEK
jgi:hypothetical protein